MISKREQMEALLWLRGELTAVERERKRGKREYTRQEAADHLRQLAESVQRQREDESHRDKPHQGEPFQDGPHRGEESKE